MVSPRDGLGNGVSPARIGLLLLLPKVDSQSWFPWARVSTQLLLKDGLKVMTGAGTRLRVDGEGLVRYGDLESSRPVKTLTFVSP